MNKKESCVRLSPEEALCQDFDCTGIKMFAAPDHKEMGVPVLNNFPEEHIQ